MFYPLALLVSVVGPSVAFVIPFADAFGLPKIAVALIGSWLLWVRCCPSRFVKTGIEKPLVFFLAVFLASLMTSIDPIVSIVGVYSQPFNGAAELLPAVLIFLAVSSEGDRWPDGPLYCAALIGIASGIACALQLARVIPAPFDMMAGRALGTMGSPVFLGAVLAPALPAALWLGSRGSLIGIAGSIGSFLALWACHSRGPWLAAAAGLWGLLAASGAIRPRWRHLAALAAVLGVLAALSGRMGKAYSDSGRIKVWKIAARAGAEHPILGSGPDTFVLDIRRLKTPDLMKIGTIQAGAHNDILQAWATMGGLGALALIWLWVSVLSELWKKAVFWPGMIFGGSTTPAFGAALALFISAKFNPVPPSAVYIVAALVGSALRLKRETLEDDGLTITSWNWRPINDRGLIWALGIGFLIATAIPVGQAMTAEALSSFGVMAFRAGEINSAADMIRQANEIYPVETTFAANRFEIIRRLSIGLKEERAKDFARRALRAGACIVKAHPQDPEAFELMSTIELWAAGRFGHGLARSAIKTSKRAVELDPFFEFSSRRWLQSAIVVGDQREIAAASAKLRSLQAIGR